MANAQVTVALTKIDKDMLGYQAISLTHPADGVAPAIAAGSKVEIAGALFEVTVDETITGLAGIANSSQIYFLFTVSGSSFTASGTITAPTWDTAKQGWYIGANRVIGGCYKDGSGNYTLKFLYEDKQVDSVRRYLDGSIAYPFRDPNSMGQLHQLPRDTTSRSPVNGAAVPGGGSWSAAIQVTGLYGVPAGAKKIRAKVIAAGGATPSGSLLYFSDNNTSTPSPNTAHPSYILAVPSPGTDKPQEMDIPLNAAGQFYTYNTVNIGAGNTYTVTALDYYLGD